MLSFADIISSMISFADIITSMISLADNYNFNEVQMLSFADIITSMISFADNDIFCRYCSFNDIFCRYYNFNDIFCRYYNINEVQMFTFSRRIDEGGSDITVSGTFYHKSIYKYTRINTHFTDLIK